MSNLEEFLLKAGTKIGMNNVLGYFKVYETEVKKYIPSKIIAWKDEYFIIAGQEYRNLYFLSEKGSIIKFRVSQYCGNQGLFIFGNHPGYDRNWHTEYNLAKCWSKDCCHISKYENTDCPVLLNQDLSLTNKDIIPIYIYEKMIEEQIKDIRIKELEKKIYILENENRLNKLILDNEKLIEETKKFLDN